MAEHVQITVRSTSRFGGQEDQLIFRGTGTLEKLPEWTEESVHTALLNLAAEQGVKNGVFLWPARIAMAGKLVTPCGAIEIAVLLGREETLRRMKDSLAKLNA